MRVIDLRSDTVTLPTREMLEVILTAPLGDDGWRDDPTVIKLEELAAEKMGKEAALLVPSGTQGNAVSILAQTDRRGEIILGARSHIYNFEGGHFAIIGGLVPKLIKDDNGYMDPSEVEAAIRPKRRGLPGTSLLCIENTHNASGGVALSPEQTRAIWDTAKDLGVPMHIDGARIFNAAIYHGVDVKELTRFTDSIMFCLSKGLSAPIGSLVCGTEEFIERARNFRRILGGMMRQAGVIAAPGIIALTKMVDRLREDHETAYLLEEGLRGFDGIKILNPVQTNMVYIDIGGLSMQGFELSQKLAPFGIKIAGRHGTVIRLVTHRGIEKKDAIYFLECLENVLAR